jgi:hypothetical protein
LLNNAFITKSMLRISMQKVMHLLFLVIILLLVLELIELFDAEDLHIPVVNP